MLGGTKYESNYCKLKYCRQETWYVYSDMIDADMLPTPAKVNCFLLLMNSTLTNLLFVYEGTCKLTRVSIYRQPTEDLFPLLTFSFNVYLFNND